MATLIQNPFEYLTDRKGDALDMGYVYIGAENQNPELFPVACFWDEGLTLPAAQPLRTTAGYIVNPNTGGSPGQVYTANAYSIRIRQRLGLAPGLQVFYAASRQNDFNKVLVYLSTPAGSGFVGFSQALTYPAATLGRKGQQDNNPLDAPYLAAGNGTADDRAALAAADAIGPLTITANHRISSNLTIANLVQIVGEGRITRDMGVTVTFEGGLVAPPNQIFYGDGDTAGLLESHLEWFAGDNATQAPTLPSVVSTVPIQKAITATVKGGTVYAGPLSWAIDGTAWDMSGGQSFQGTGLGQAQTAFYWNGTARNGFSFTGTAILGAFAKGCRFDCLNASVSPVSGVALYTTQSETVFDDIETTGAYVGIHFKSMVIGRATNVRHNDCLRAPLIIEDALDIFYDKWNHSALGDLVTMTGTPTGGAYTAGSAVACATGSTGVVIAAYSATLYRMQWFGIRPPVAGTITATGKSGTVASVVVSHQIGSVRFVSTSTLCEGNSILSGDSVGGEYGLVSAGSGTLGRLTGNTGYNYIAPDALFDVCYSGSSLDCGYGWVIDGWFASSRNPDTAGLSLVKCTRIFGTPRCTNNAGAGIQWDGTSQHIYIKSNMDGNCRNYTLGDMAEIRITSTAGHWAIEGGMAGWPGLNGGPDPVKAMYVAVGCNNFSVNVDAPIGSITNLSTGANQDWGNTPGMDNRTPLLRAFADDVAAAAGTPPVQIGGHYRTASGVKQRVS